MVYSAGVRIFRSPDIWMDRNRRYKVIVDGSAVGELWPKENGLFDFPPGEHRIHVKIDFMRSNEMTVSAESGEVLELSCTGRGSLPALFRTIFRRSSYLDLHRITPEERKAVAAIAEGRVPPIPRNLNSHPNSADSSNPP